MNDGKLIEVVRRYPAIYDRNHRNYKKVSFTKEIWSSIGKEMELSGSFCKERWRAIRGIYRKSLKKIENIKSGESIKDLKLYKYFHQLNFLSKFYDEPKAEESVPLTLEQETRLYEDSNKEDVVQMQNIKQDSRSQDSQDTSGSNLVKCIFSMPDPVDSFLAGIGFTLKSFTPSTLKLAKREILSIVQKYEMQELKQQSDNEFFIQKDSLFHDYNHSRSSSPNLGEQISTKQELINTSDIATAYLEYL